MCQKNFNLILYKVDKYVDINSYNSIFRTVKSI